MAGSSSRGSNAGKTGSDSGFRTLSRQNGVVSDDTSALPEQDPLPGLNTGREPALARELAELRLDNARLRKLLELSEEQAAAAHADQPVISATMPAGPVTMHSTPETKVLFFESLFRCRNDVYATRWENTQDGRSGWVPAVVGGWHKGKPRDSVSFLTLTPAVVADHLTGAKHIGLYPLTEKDTCWWIAADFDGSAAMMDALA